MEKPPNPGSVLGGNQQNSFMGAVAGIYDATGARIGFFNRAEDAEYVVSLSAHIEALEARLAEAKAERDEYYARGFGLRSHVVRYLNRNVSKETLREAFMRWESASGTRFSISPAALEATPPAPMVTEALTIAHEALEAASDQILESYRTWVADDKDAKPRYGQYPRYDQVNAAIRVVSEALTASEAKQ
ncbi:MULTISPECIES: hypothetical protein [unclassified Aminobacter]|uniref:hypothetical protein n=1 Tax=unclassified Aminobacter TaxID=2644704 RepID=UPI0011A5425A|nr:MULTISPECIES: hypothetical protein [unclassified Aminobacter]